MEVIRDFISKDSEAAVTVYTDGSVYGGGTGCGACSAILYPPSSDSRLICDC